MSADYSLWIIVQDRRIQAADAARERLALASRPHDGHPRRGLAGMVARLRTRVSRSPDHTLRPVRGASGR